MKLVRRRDRSQREQGQGLVEFALVLPIVAILMVSVLEVGLIYGAMQSVGYASREGARVAAAFADGTGDCAIDPGGGNPSNPDPTLRIPPVDAVAVGAAQRIIQSPDSGVRLARVDQIRIFRADAAGRQIGNQVNTWGFVGAGNGPDVDPGVGTERIAFAEQGTAGWPACNRSNGGPTGVDSVGFTVRYTYDFVTPMGAVLNALSGGNFNVTLAETTVMALNPTL